MSTLDTEPYVGPYLSKDQLLREGMVCAWHHKI
jgi:hypothetical protein